MNKEELKNRAAYVMEIENRIEHLSDEDRCFYNEMRTRYLDIFEDFIKAASMGDGDAMTVAINAIAEKVEQTYGEPTLENYNKLIYGSIENYNRYTAIAEIVDPVSKKLAKEFQEDMELASQCYEDNEVITIAQNTISQQVQNMEQVSDYLQDEEM
jgi:hypothetical protein